jgi:glucose/arabinose dehydrogenase
MSRKLLRLLTIVPFLIAASCGSSGNDNSAHAATTDTLKGGGDTSGKVVLPAPFATKSAHNFSKVIGWSDGKMPIAPQGFIVSKFADGLQNPRWVYVGSNGDIFVCESNGKNDIIKTVAAKVSGKSKSGNVDENGSANRITLFRDTDGDGAPDVKVPFLTDLYHPLGMLILGDRFYVANNDAVVSFPYKQGQTSITAKGQKVTDLAGGSGHWTRNIIASADGKKIYAAVGSGSNVADDGMEKEAGKALIWEMALDGSGRRVYASGLRNPVGMAWAPGTNTLWTVVNERDALGDDLVPDYLTSVRDGGFYGWPYSYWGQHENPRLKDKQRPDLVQKAIEPDVSMGAHTASLGLAFDGGNFFPGKYKGGAFIGQHGSWNRSQLSGYAVTFVPFKNGKPTGKMEPFLTGFIADTANSKVYGRPVGVAFTKNGDLLVADDVSNTIWQVSVAK